MATLLDLVEETFTVITLVGKKRTEADGFFRLLFGGMLAHAPRSLAKVRIASES